MDHYVVKFDMQMLYFDMLELIELMKQSKEPNMQAYVEYLEKVLEDENL